MNERGLTKLRERIKPRWDDERAARVRAAIQGRSRRVRALRTAGGAMALLVVGAALVVHLRGFAPRPEARVESTTATPLGADAVLESDPSGGGRAFTLKKGGARFAVVHDEAHPFRVRVGTLLVEDVGTAFTIRWISETIVEVAVDEGRVRVTGAGRTTELGPAERRTFEAQDVPSETATDAGTNAGAEEDTRSPPRPVKTPSWRPLAENGRYREAFDALRRSGAGTVHDDVADLLLAADAARLSDHPAEAVPYLDQVVRSHGSDPRASLASFTLGRVLLDELGRPIEAAAAFEGARKGALAEDALAREVEAWSRGGDTTRARNLAIEYEKTYPEGRRSRTVAKFGGLE
jgi:transmembrane sensor